MYKVVSRVNLKFCSNSFSLKKKDDSSIAELRFLVTRIKKYSSIEKAFSPLPPPRRSFPRRKQVLSRTFFFSPSPGSRDGSRLPPGDTRKRPVSVPVRASPSRSSQITKGIGNGFISPPFLILLHA